jgi:hypothetical protein
MITKEMLDAIEGLRGLSDDQKKEIIQLSENDENAVIARKTSEFWKGIDDDVLEVTGKGKPGKVKSYDNLKAVLREYKEAAEGSPDAAKLKADIEERDATIKDLQKQIANGKGNEAMKAQIQALTQERDDLTARASKLETQLKTEKEAFEAKIAEKEQATKDVRVRGILANSRLGLSFKEEIPESVLPTLIEAAEAKILGMGTPDFIEGGKDFIIRDEDGLPITNKNNGQKPYLGSELMAEQLADIIKEDRKKTGAGTGKPGSGGSGGGLNLAGVKSQNEASEIIADHLNRDLGLAAGTKEYQEKWDSIVTENNILELPIQV